MKPQKKKKYCPALNRQKMLFDSKQEAESFMRFNNSEIISLSEYVPCRAYYCSECGGWHLTHLPDVSLSNSIIGYGTKSSEEIQNGKKFRVTEGVEAYISSQLKIIERQINNNEYSKAMKSLTDLSKLCRALNYSSLKIKEIKQKKENVGNILYGEKENPS